MNTENILRNDSMINNIVVSREMVENNIYQCKMERETITKYVYKTHNEVFNVNRQIDEAPKCKCIFTMHTKKKSSYVQIFDMENKEIFTGNSLWGIGESSNYEKHIDFIKLLHSVEDIKQKYNC